MLLRRFDGGRFQLGQLLGLERPVLLLLRWLRRLAFLGRRRRGLGLLPRQLTLLELRDAQAIGLRLHLGVVGLRLLDRLAQLPVEKVAHRRLRLERPFGVEKVALGELLLERRNLRLRELALLLQHHAQRIDLTLLRVGLQLER